MSRLPQSSADESPEVLLRQFFRRGGYVRVANKTRRTEKGPRSNKSYEVRLVAKTHAELMQIRELVRQVGFDPAATFVKGNRIVQPIYGKAVVEWFLSISVE
jgi:hypothetical protein